MPTQWTVIPPIRRHFTCRTDTPSESGRVVRCSWTSSPTRRLKVNATMIPSIMEDIPFMTLFDRPRRTDVTIRAMSAATRMFVPQYGETAKPCWPDWSRLSASSAASRTSSVDARLYTRNPPGVALPARGGEIPRSSSTATVACSLPCWERISRNRPSIRVRTSSFLLALATAVFTCASSEPNRPFTYQSTVAVCIMNR